MKNLEIQQENQHHKKVILNVVFQFGITIILCLGSCATSRIQSDSIEDKDKAVELIEYKDYLGHFKINVPKKYSKRNNFEPIESLIYLGDESDDFRFFSITPFREDTLSFFNEKAIFLRNKKNVESSGSFNEINLSKIGSFENFSKSFVFTSKIAENNSGSEYIEFISYNLMLKHRASSYIICFMFTFKADTKFEIIQSNIVTILNSYSPLK